MGGALLEHWEWGGAVGRGGGVGRGRVDGLGDVYLGRGGQCDANRCN